jgi:hypothetical protein
MNMLAQVPMKLFPFNETAAGGIITRSRGYINTNSTSALDLPTSRSRIARAERSTCLPCRNLDLIKNSGAKIITVNYYACKFHKSCRFQLNFVNRLSFDFSIVDFRSAQI